MSKTKSLKTRKLPLQTRARVSVEAILEASAQVLAEGGYRKFSTNKVAQRAGVSIGTLYQYFPNKESLIAAIQQKHLDDLSEILRIAFAQARDQNFHTAIRTMIEAGIALHSVNPKLHAVLSHQVARLDAQGENRELVQLIENGLSEFLARHRERIIVRDRRSRYFSSRTSSKAPCTQRWSRGRPPCAQGRLPMNWSAW